MDNFFEIQNFSVSLIEEKKKICDKISLSLGQGKTHFVMGKNGSGKTTLLMGLFSHMNYKSTGKILLEGKNIANKDVEKKVSAGMFLSFQSPVGISGLSVSQMLKYSINSIRRSRKLKPLNAPQFFRKLDEVAKIVGVKKDWLSKDINVNFSGGEKKKLEMMQMILAEPKVAFLDEPDSGVDVNSVKIIAKAIEYCRKEFNTSFVVITHYHKLFELIKVDKVHILQSGKIIKSGSEKLGLDILKEGF